uniref:Uncharacterized protein n=1 Tax=Anguilla anguilla TaxID=7936 RepID=A0A0E9SSP5_ANGAN
MVFITLLESKCEITHTRTHTHITKNKSAVSVISHFDSKRVMKIIHVILLPLSAQSNTIAVVSLPSHRVRLTLILLP